MIFRRNAFRIRLWMAAILIAITTVPMRGAVTTTGDVNPDPPTFGLGGTLIIGQTADGTMTVNNGSRVDNSTGFVGLVQDVTGIATLDGAGTLWETFGNLTLGLSGNGTLNIQNEAQAISNNLYLGNFAAASGDLAINGTRSLMAINNTLVVGRSGTGTLTLQNGASATSFTGSVADNINSNGSVTIDGPGSFWNLFNLYLGREGAATLDITNGGRVQSEFSSFGWLAASTGTVTLDGTNSRLFTNKLQVATAGAATLIIVNGATATSATSTEIGVLAGSTGVVTIDGPDSQWYPSSLHVGMDGNGTLNIRNGALVQTGSTRVGSDSPGMSQIIFDGGTLNVLNELKTSPQDLLGTGTINTAGMASDIDLLFDATHGTQQQIIFNTAPGQNVTLNLNQQSGTPLGAGYRGNGTLTITDGVTIVSGEGMLGDLVGASGTATVNGPGSTWQNNDGIIVGNNGIGVLSIQRGASVTLDDHLRIANFATASGTVNLTDGMLDLAGNYILFGQGIGSFNFTGGTLKDVRIINSDLHQQGGVFAPGNKIGLGTSLISGDYTLAAGTLELELAGATTFDYDRLEISGTVMINGMLEASLINGFTPAIGDSFDVLTTPTGITGTFSSVAVPDGINVIYSPTTITLATQLLGDLNADGFVGIADLNITLINWNQNVPAGSWIHGDTSGDGFVGIDDLNLILTNWNAGSPPEMESLASVPEPGTFAVGLCVVVGLLFVKPKRSAC